MHSYLVIGLGIYGLIRFVTDITSEKTVRDVNEKIDDLNEKFDDLLGSEYLNQEWNKFIDKRY